MLVLKTIAQIIQCFPVFTEQNHFGAKAKNFQMLELELKILRCLDLDPESKI